MSTTANPIVYPTSDGKPMAENTLQWRWIVTIVGGLRARFADDPNVFIAGDLLWYPVEGRPDIRVAPDGLVAFGRPRGERGAYLQWQEGNIAPQVVFEVLSPGNRGGEMARKFQFYQRYGVEEYYLYDPDDNTLAGWQRRDGELEAITPIQGWHSPLLGVSFGLGPSELELRYPDGRRFLSYEELYAQSERARAAAGHEHERAERERERAEREHERAERERERAEHLAARLRALGIDPDAE
jgi:Uma2 family endonuclease